MQPGGKAPFSLYIHIPYCISKCPYCDFNSHVVAEIPERSYTNALTRELVYYAEKDPWRGKKIKTIFFGGGTPSTFHPESIKKILHHVAEKFSILSDCEITLEANPGTVDSNNFRGYAACGVNRISVGIQSFQPRLLKFLGRAHSAQEGKKALQIVREAGFENFNLDLIYANPGQTLEELAADLDTALLFRSPHLSAYNLTIEEGTPFHRDYRNGKLQTLSEDDEIAMANLIEDRLNAAGLLRYEISNYARPNFQSRHNVNYWQSGDYLGLGAGAHSYQPLDGRDIYGIRWWNEKNPSKYIAMIESKGTAVVETEKSRLEKAAGEFMFSGLRLIDGISGEAFNQRFGKTPLEFYPQIADWIDGGLVDKNNSHLRLTRRGLMVANSLFVHFV